MWFWPLRWQLSGSYLPAVTWVENCGMELKWLVWLNDKGTKFSWNLITTSLVQGRLQVTLRKCTYWSGTVPIFWDVEMAAISLPPPKYLMSVSMGLFFLSEFLVGEYVRMALLEDCFGFFFFISEYTWGGWQPNQLPQLLTYPHAHLKDFL